MFLASPWLEIYVLTGHFANFEQFKIDRYADFGQIKIDILLHFYYIWAGYSNFTEFGQDL